MNISQRRIGDRTFFSLEVDDRLLLAFNQEEALVGAFSVITNLRMDLFEALAPTRAQLCPAPAC